MPEKPENYTEADGVNEVYRILRIPLEDGYFDDVWVEISSNWQNAWSRRNNKNISIKEYTSVERLSIDDYINMRKSLIHNGECQADTSSLRGFSQTEIDYVQYEFDRLKLSNEHIEEIKGMPENEIKNALHNTRKGMERVIEECPILEKVLFNNVTLLEKFCVREMLLIKGKYLISKINHVNDKALFYNNSFGNKEVANMLRNLNAVISAIDILNSSIEKYTVKFPVKSLENIDGYILNWRKPSYEQEIKLTDQIKCKMNVLGVDLALAVLTDLKDNEICRLVQNLNEFFTRIYSQIV